MFKWIFLGGIYILSITCHSQWQYPGINHQFGFWEASVGIHGWSDHLVGRNLQLRHTAYLYPGLRWFTVIRGNNEFDQLTPFSPQFDEQFIEHLAIYQKNRHQLSYSFKGGKVRYLRFPKPDRISMFDQVTGTEDLRENKDTDYSGILGIAEYEYYLNKGTGIYQSFIPNQVGYHITAIQWIGHSVHRGYGTPEQYVFFKKNWGPVYWETRYGQLAIRAPQPLGRSEMGIVSYLGFRKWNYEIGFLFENIKTQPYRTGVLVEFALSPVTKALGKVHFDYTRSPEGFVVQLPFWKGYWGVQKEIPENATYLGRISAERTTTYWQNGQGRNFYEHILSHDVINADDDIIIVVEEGPWHLKLESLVSPHSTFRNWGDFQEWERKRQGPAQLAQYVTYKIYKK